MTDNGFAWCFFYYCFACCVIIGLVFLAGCAPDLPEPGGRPETGGLYAPLPGAIEFCVRNPEAEQCRFH